MGKKYFETLINASIRHLSIEMKVQSNYLTWFVVDVIFSLKINVPQIELYNIVIFEKDLSFGNKAPC